MNNRNENVKHKTKHLVLRKAGEQLLKRDGHSASLDYVWIPCIQNHSDKCLKNLSLDLVKHLQMFKFKL